MIRLFDSAFSPFARKVRLVLEHKELPFETVDGLLKANHDALRAVNGRVEVPVLVDEGVVVVNSADIVAYLEFRYPDNPVYPASAAARVHARAWERTADTLIDSVLINISYWLWADRQDAMPDGLMDVARKELNLVYERLDQDLAGREFVCGTLSTADLALFPHIVSAKAMRVDFSRADRPHLTAWFERLRRLPICMADLRRAREYIARIKSLDVERRRIFWRGDRIEWMLSHGFHDWFWREIAEGRVLWPGSALPAPSGS
jgi:glutathione S-transferase